MSSLRAIAAWTSPVMCATLAARVFSGHADAPLLVLLAAVAPLVALLATPRPCGSLGDVVIIAPGLAAVLSANVSMLVELGRQHGFDRDAALGAAALLVVAPVIVSVGGDAWVAPIAALGIAGIVAPLVIVGAEDGMTPWAAWTDVVSRPALVFGDRSGWTTEGRELPRMATLVFTEPHRLTVLTPVTCRVTEHDGGRDVVRDHRLSSGEAVALRPGDRVKLPAGTRVRFEAGKRVPDVAVSGVAWANPRDPHGVRALLERLGLAMTLIGGARALVAPLAAGSFTAALSVPIVLIALVIGSACWGLYAIHAAPELAVGAGWLTPLVQLPPLVADPRGGTLLVGALGVALLVLFAVTAAGLWNRVRFASLPASRPAATFGLWLAISGVAFAGALRPSDPWHVWTLGVGFLASVSVAPALAGGDRRASRAGAIAGASIYFGVAAIAALRVIALGPLALYPALVAAPLAWLAASLVSRRAGGHRNDPGGHRNDPRSSE
jgi:hypothetical protein